MPDKLLLTDSYPFKKLFIEFYKNESKLTAKSKADISKIYPHLAKEKEIALSDLFPVNFVRLIKNSESLQKNKSIEHNTYLRLTAKKKLMVKAKIISLQGKKGKLSLIPSLALTELESGPGAKNKTIDSKEPRFRVLYDNNPLMIFAVDTGGNILSINSKVNKVLKYKSNDLIGYSFNKLLNVEDHKIQSGYLRKCLRTPNKMFSHEIRINPKNSASLWAREYLCAFTDEDGKIEILIVCDDITHRKAKEHALRLSEEKFFNAFYISPDSININRISDGLYIDINHGFMKLTGYSKEEVIGKTSIELNIWNDLKDREELLKLLQKKGEVKDFEATFRLKDGSLKTGMMSAKIIKIQNEPCILSITKDITERKKAEKILIENEIKYKTLFDFANDAIFIMKDDTFVDCNKRTLEVFLCSREEILGQSPFKFSPVFQPDGKFSDAKGINLINQALSGIPQFFEWKHVRLNGELFDAEVSLNKVEFGNDVYLQAIVRDITDRKGAEGKITLLAHALKSISESVSITDMSDRVLFLNDAFVKTYGYTLEELKDNPISRVRSVNNPPEITSDILNQTLRGGWSGELLNVKKDGTEFYIHLSTSVIRDDQGRAIALIGVSTDITEQKKAREELISAKYRAEEMNRLKSTFLANMSHELRTPLVGILGFAEMMLNEDNAEEKKLMTEMILSSGRRLQDTLNSLLDLARIEANRVELRFKKFDLGKVTESAVRAFEGFAYTKNLSLVTKIISQPVEVYLDETLLIQVINNLVNNALKYTLTGGVVVEVDSFIENDVPHCRIKVTDTGIGIDKNDSHIIFEEFRQVSEGFNRQFEGTGLGLTLTKKFVEIMNGKIFLESTVGAGSTFTVIFPCINRDVAHPAADQDKSKKDEKQALTFNSGYTPRLLLVENDSISAEVTKYYLKDSFELHTCADGVSAIELATQNNYDCILMDINLGNSMSGTDVVKLIRKIPDYTGKPIVALTAFAMEGDKNEFIKAGCSHYLSKPFTKNSIMTLLGQIFNHNNR